MERVEDSSRSLIDISLYSRIDEALGALTVAFQSLVAAGLVQDDDDLVENTESDGVVVYAREIGVQAAAALQAVSRLKQTAIQSDWAVLEANKKRMKMRYEMEMETAAQKFHDLKQETRNLLKLTEEHFQKFPRREAS